MSTTIDENVQAAEQRWGVLDERLKKGLAQLSDSFGFTVPAGDLLLLEGGWYVTHSGLLRYAQKKRLAGIHVRPIPEFSDPTKSRWAFEAVVYKTRNCRGFSGYGDADAFNVSLRVRGAEMRVAETRAVNRALRKAYGIGICSVEELGSFSGPLQPAQQSGKPRVQSEAVNGNGRHPLRDRLYLLIRQHKLDAALVKAYAADYCDVGELRDATRDQIAGFIKHLAEYATADRESLLCQLNSYGPKPATQALVQISPSGTDDESEKAAGVA